MHLALIQKKTIFISLTENFWLNLWLGRKEICIKYDKSQGERPLSEAGKIILK
jgi:hypothetical protein